MADTTIEQQATRTIEGLQADIRKALNASDFTHQEEPCMSDQTTIADGYRPITILVDLTQEAELLAEIPSTRLASMTKPERDEAATNRAAAILYDNLPVSRRRAMLMAEVMGDPDSAGGYQGRHGFDPDEVPSVFGGDHDHHPDGAEAMATTTGDND